MPGTCTYTFISTNMYYKTLPINWLLWGYYYYRFAHKHAYILKYGMGSIFAIIKFPIWLQWPKWSLTIGCCKPSVLKAYRIARNFHLEKIFAFFAQVRRGWKTFGELFYPVKILSCWNFTRTGFYTWLPNSTSSASWSSISCFTWYSKPLLSWSAAKLDVATVVAPRVLPDHAGPLSSELSPSAIAEANAAVNGVQQAKTKETKKWEIDCAEVVHTVCVCEYGTSTFDIRAQAWRVHSRASSTTSWWATRTVGEIKFGEFFVPVQSMSIERNFYSAKILCYMVLQSIP